MRIAVMGTGGVGGYFGGLLARAGEDVTFIARGEHLAALQNGGLHVSSVHGDFDLESVNATDTPSDVGPVDLVLFTVKTYQIEQAAGEMAPLVGPETAILPLQNGVDASERLIRIFGEGPVLGGTCRVVSFVAAPGVIEQKSDFRHITLGELDGPITPRVNDIAAVLEKAGAQVEVTDNIQKARWTKFLFIASFSGVGAAARAPAGEMMACPETRATLVQAFREIEALATASGVTLDPDIVEKTMAFCDNMTPGTTASMQRDIMEGRHSELEAQNGFVARRGAELGVPVPAHTFLYSVLLPQERRARGEVAAG
jgi:2-dehydropantoate 2-reductase